MADALCSSAIFEQMGGKMARELLSNSFHHTSRVKLSKGKANKGNKAAKKKTTEMFKKDFVAQLKAAFEKCSKQTLKHKLADIAGSVKSEGGEGVKVNNNKKKQKKKKQKKKNKRPSV